MLCAHDHPCLFVGTSSNLDDVLPSKSARLTPTKVLSRSPPGNVSTIHVGLYPNLLFMYSFISDDTYWSYL